MIRSRHLLIAALTLCACAAGEEPGTPDAGNPAPPTPIAPGVEIHESSQEGAWVKDRRAAYTYGAAGELLERTEEAFDGTAWVPTDRTRRVWEDGTRLKEVVEESLQPDGTTWLPTSKTEYAWEAGLLVEATWSTFAPDFDDLPNGTWTQSRISSWERDASGAVSSITTRVDAGEVLPQNRVVSFERDAAGRISKVTDADGQATARAEYVISYDVLGRVERVLLTSPPDEAGAAPTVARASVSYGTDGRGRQTLVELQKADGSWTPAERFTVEPGDGGARVQLFEEFDGAAWVATKRIVATPRSPGSHATWTGDWALGSGDLDEGLLYGTPMF